MIRQARELAAYRVDRGEGGFRAIPMTEKEVDDRCFFIRIRLRGKSAWKLSNAQIEQVRVYRMGDTWVIEDEHLMTFVLEKEEKKIAPVQDAVAALPADLAADGYTYCGSFAEAAEEEAEKNKGQKEKYQKGKQYV